MPQIQKQLPRVSPINNDVEDELITVLKDMMQHERELEEAKIVLAQCSDFNLMDAFQMIDAHKKGWITAPELLDIMQEFGQYCHRDDVYTFVRRFDLDSDGRLLYSDFCDAFVPKDPYYSNVLNSRHAEYIHRGVTRFNFFMP